MTFWKHFARLLIRRPKPALTALYWHLTRRRVRARNTLHYASADLPFVYTAWIATKERNSELSRRWEDIAAEWRWRPRFSILLYRDGDCSEEDLKRSIRSIEEQIYPCLEMVGAADDPLGTRIERATGDFVVPLHAGDQLAETALFRFAEAAQPEPRPAILYGDEDRLDEQGRRRRPWFKPQWNEELFYALDYLSSSVAIETSLAREAAIGDDSANLSTILLRATARAQGHIPHVPHILCHVRPRTETAGDRVQSVAAQLQAAGALCTQGPFGTVKVQWPLPSEPPQVTIIIPTRDKLELLQPCVDGLLERTDYPNFDLLIVDNGSIERKTHDYLDHLASNPKVRIVPFPHPYNFSAMNNFAVGQATGEYVCLLNNDTEVVEPAWLTELMRYAVRPEVGAVGAKLLYDDGSIQHAGVVIGIGQAAGHAHRFLPAGDAGYFHMPHAAQFVSAVTAACLVVEKSKFEAVGGLPDDLPVAFNDVDLCLKLGAAGWKNVYVPHAVLVHHESKTREKDTSRNNIDRFRREMRILQERWGTKEYQDPLHNPNLDRGTERFIIGF